jgi:transposase
MQASPETLLKAMAPSRDARVVAVACLCPWYGLVDLCARAGMPFGLGHALSMQAMHGGTAKNDRSASPKSAVVRRGGMLPQASVSPAERRATRDLRRRRMPLRRPRAALLAHVHNPHSPYHVPERGKKIASQAPRHGVAARFPAPAGHQRLAVDLALIDDADRLRSALELSIVQTAQPHAPNTLSRLQTVPGVGTIVSLVLLDAIHDRQRFPRGPDGGPSCRLVTCAKASASTRSGTSGKKRGNAALPWALSAAAVLWLRHKAHGQTCLARGETKHGQGQALTIVAPQLARAVYARVTRATVCEMAPGLTGDGSRVGEPAASLATEGISLQTVLGNTVIPCVMARGKGQRRSALLPRD